MNDNLALLIMAAGMGSRYGGLKQIESIDDYGNLIIDFSIYDAIKAGFKKVVFVIKKEIEDEFKEKIGNRISKFVDVEYVFQELDDIPDGFSVPEGREKPWGTGQAILAAKNYINGCFAVINADDYYGQEAFKTLYESLSSIKDNKDYKMVGYNVENTLSENGTVTRGVCFTNNNNELIEIHERSGLEEIDNKIYYDDNNKKIEVPKKTIVSMNLWGFTNGIFDELECEFEEFLKNEVPDNPLKSEYLIPEIVDSLIKSNKASVEVLHSPDKWYGVTYKKDRNYVINAIKNLKKSGIYPERLWDN